MIMKYIIDYTLIQLILVHLISFINTQPISVEVNVTEYKQYCRNGPPYLAWLEVRQKCWIANTTIWNHDHHQLANKAHAIELARRHQPSVYLENPKAGVDNIYVYIHAFILKRKIGGLLILDKLLDSIRASGLQMHAKIIYVVISGRYRRSHLDELKSQYHLDKVRYIESNISSYFEYPTLTIMQQHARTMHPQSKILYLHTKGTTKLHENSFRKVMRYFHIDRYEDRIKTLDQGKDLVGAITIFEKYMIDYFNGNFFWTKARYLTHTMDVTGLVWDWRFGAERWIMSNRSLSCLVFHSNYTQEYYVNYGRSRGSGDIDQEKLYEVSKHVIDSECIGTVEPINKCQPNMRNINPYV